MIVYLASPSNQMQADKAKNMPVLFSYALYKEWLDDYQPTFSRILIDSGAFSEFSSGVKIDGAAYKDWYPRWEGHADAIAGLDDIRGDWKRSLKNYEKYGGFPTIHEADPPDLLPDLVEISRKQGKNWIGIGLTPPRTGKEDLVRSICDRMPDDLHVHGFALREYTHVRRLDSVDSTNWWRDVFKLRLELPFLTSAECLEIVVKRYQRWKRVIVDKKAKKGFGV